MEEYRMKNAANLMYMAAPCDSANAIGLFPTMYSSPEFCIENCIVSKNPVNEEFRKVINSIEGSKVRMSNEMNYYSMIGDEIKSALRVKMSSLESIASLSGFYFDGKFKTKFDHKNTFDSECIDSNAKPVDCQLMRTVATVKYHDDGKRRIVCIHSRQQVKLFFLLMSCMGSTLCFYNQQKQIKLNKKQMKVYS
eukprot:GHVR01077719.1.p1 GENE.GHVR01077719.1~~GHVR01077719.1.p1  ORF type:complete len:194 (+),score=22.68 GHVR01077719.1:284-865(+)